MKNNRKQYFINIIDNINNNGRIIDIGGGKNPHPCATHILDKQKFNDVIVDIDDYPKYSKDTYTESDFYNLPWPFPDKYFDFSICTHTLEDLKDPIPIISEIIRISQKGYISTPTRAQESTMRIINRNKLENGITGYSHHRWFVEIINDELTFINKCWLLPFNKELLITRVGQTSLHYFWCNSFKYKEVYIGDTNNVYDNCKNYKSAHLEFLKNPDSITYNRWDEKLGKKPDFSQLLDNYTRFNYLCDKLKTFKQNYISLNAFKNY